ncbi:MAG: hypothetical protein QOG72_1160 [Sphingomonadales bacterium]|jgi:hypothetical protein|nr:hypothetical protein [Sphingomonadales bacterium]
MVRKNPMTCALSLPLGAAAMLSAACEPVPEHVAASHSVDGCYHDAGRLVLRLRHGRFQVPGRGLSGSFERSETDVGTEIVFTPAVQLRTEPGDQEIVVYPDLPRGHQLVFERDGAVYIPMPTDPLGQRLLKQRPCPRDPKL